MAAFRCCDLGPPHRSRPLSSPVISTPKYLAEREVKTCLHKELYINVYSSPIYNSPKMETIQKCIRKSLLKGITARPHNGITRSSKKDQTPHTRQQRGPASTDAHGAKEARRKSASCTTARTHNSAKSTHLWEQDADQWLPRVRHTNEGLLGKRRVWGGQKKCSISCLWW